MFPCAMHTVFQDTAKAPEATLTAKAAASKFSKSLLYQSLVPGLKRKGHLFSFLLWKLLLYLIQNEPDALVLKAGNISLQKFSRE